MFVRFAVMRNNYIQSEQVVEFPTYEAAELYMMERCDRVSQWISHYHIQKKFYPGIDPILSTEE